MSAAGARTARPALSLGLHPAAAVLRHLARLLPPGDPVLPARGLLAALVRGDPRPTTSFVDGFSLSLQVGVLATLDRPRARRAGGALPRALSLQRPRAPLNSLLLMPLIVPGVVLGTAIYVFQVEAEIATGWPILGSLGGLVAGHVADRHPLDGAPGHGEPRRLRPRHRGGGAEPRRQRLDDLPAHHAAGDPARHRRRRAVRLRHLVRQSRDEPVPGRPRPHHAADRDPAVSRMEDRPDHRGGVGAADPADRRRDAGHRPLRQDRRGWSDHGAARARSASPSATATSTPSTTSRSTSPTASSWCCSARPAAARPRPCAWSRASSSRPRGACALGGATSPLLPPWKRNAGMVFQSYALFPHMTVAENVAFGLEMRKLPKAEIDARASRRRCAWCGSSGYGDRLPRQLSGGQQQRVALARALAIRPDVLLLDEPLSNLDAKLRQEVRVEIRELQRQLGLTTVMVTHDQEEALTMADRLVVMNEGAVRQIGTPARPLRAPGRPLRRGLRRPQHLPRRHASRRPGASAPPAASTSPATRRRAGHGRAGAAARAARDRRGAVADSTTACPARWNSSPISAPLIDIHVRLSPADRRGGADRRTATAASRRRSATRSRSAGSAIGRPGVCRA